MRDEVLSVDQREQRLVASERMIARLREVQMRDLAELDVAQVATGDGSRSLSEWVAGRLDMSVDSAKSLVRTMRRLLDRPDLSGLLAEGSVSFDRVEALSRIPEDVGLMEWADVAGVRREASLRVRVTAEDEYRTARDRFLVLQPNLDVSWWRLWGGLDGPFGSLMDKVLSEAADAIPALPDGSSPGDAGWKRATALVEILTSDDPPLANVTVIVDTEHAAGTNGEAGVYLEAGPNVGREALQGILCDADTQVLARDQDGRFMDYGRRQRTAPPALKRALIHAAHGQCQADGCDSRRRLQIHHLVPWSQGGETNQTELVVLCWFHHQVVVHQRGFQIYFHHQRRVRFHRPQGRPPDLPRPS
ncbi:MAG TPA: DUF222 domain-containing protein [Acidimicrobiia bacterium]|nr:DUF222 domain-containing protein [Acidimicrobiia bacterium]